MASVLCPVCLGPSPEGSGGLRQCGGCGHIFQFPCERTIRYDSRYIDGFSERPEAAMSALRVGFVKAFASSGRLLDVGYGTGAFVREALKAGYDAYGSDVHGMDCGVREASLDAGGHWDVVTFFDSLEHFPDFDAIRSLAGRAGVVVVSLPMTPLDLMSNRVWRHYKPGEHLHYFSVRSLRTLFSPMRLLFSSDVEDTVRGRLSGRQNILTVVFAS